ncbi:MAG: ABC transporter permease, partial [Actinobacteria bacterium]|nr:ABC transporter permease [Actinomycetota bacterium]
TGLASQVLVSAGGHADRAALARSLTGIAPGAAVTGRAGALAAFAAQQQTGAWVSYLFIAALIGYATVSLVNTIVTATARRRPQLRLLRLAGATAGQVRRMLTIEALMSAAAGIVLGTLVAMAALLPFDSALGVPGLPAGPAWIYLTVTGAAALLTVAVTRLSARLLDTFPGRG